MLVRDIEKAWEHSAAEPWTHGLPLDRTALVHLCRRIEPPAGRFSILELGGGRSTFLWQALEQLGLLHVSVDTVLHHATAASALKERLAVNANFRVHPLQLKQISEDEWTQVFDEAWADVKAPWSDMGAPVPPEHYDHYTIQRTFYAEIDRLPLAPESVDALIVDGPHGHGRSLAYPLLADKLKPEALVLVDDFDHYPFLDDLGRVFAFEELYRDVIRDTRWALVRLQGRRRAR